LIASMVNINSNNIAGTDLNLLKVFDAIMRTRHVTRAAEDMSLGQPAMSQALGRLRVLFDDALFVRTSNGMEPTRRAHEIAGPISRALEEVAVALHRADQFDPASGRCNFRIGMSDFTEVLLLPLLIERAQSEAPNVTFTIIQLELGGYQSLLDDDKIDLAVGYLPDTAPWHACAPLFNERRTCVYAPEQISKTAISLETYVSSAHVVHSLGGNTTSAVDDALRELGQRRNIVLSTPRFSTLPPLLRRFPLIATLPSRLAEIYCAEYGLISSNIPFETPSFDVSMLWHTRNSGSAQLAWLRNAVSDLIGDG